MVFISDLQLVRAQVMLNHRYRQCSPSNAVAVTAMSLTESENLGLSFLAVEGITGDVRVLKMPKSGVEIGKNEDSSFHRLLATPTAEWKLMISASII